MVPVFKPLIEQEEIDASRESLELGWLGMGSYVSSFEAKVKDIIGAPDRHVAALSTGTAGLHIALLVAGVGPGDEVIVSSFNCSADFQAISWCGADIVFCDCTDDTLAIDLDKANQLVTPRTRAIIVMDYDCILCDHDAVAAFAARHGIRVIHDAAHSFGSRYQGKMVGSFSDICVFSHDPVKTVTCLDGGTIVVPHRGRTAPGPRAAPARHAAAGRSHVPEQARLDVRRRARRLPLSHAQHARGDWPGPARQAAEVIASTRRAAYARLQRRPGRAASGAARRSPTSRRQPVPLLHPRAGRASHSLRDFLKAEGVDTGIHWQPGHWFTLWQRLPAGDLTVTDRVGAEILSLPLHSKMPLATVHQVADKVHTYFGRRP